MMKAVGQIANAHAYGVTLRNAEDCARLHAGDRFVLSVDERGECHRLGIHEIREVCPSIGAVTTWGAVRDMTPAACDGDWIVVFDRIQPWSPYPIGSIDPAPADTEA